MKNRMIEVIIASTILVSIIGIIRLLTIYTLYNVDISYVDNIEYNDYVVIYKEDIKNISCGSMILFVDNNNLAVGSIESAITDINNNRYLYVLVQDSDVAVVSKSDIVGVVKASISIEEDSIFGIIVY